MLVASLIITSDAKDSRFFSPPEIPRVLSGTPITVSAHLVRPSYMNNTTNVQSIKSFKRPIYKSTPSKTTCCILVQGGGEYMVIGHPEYNDKMKES